MVNLTMTLKNAIKSALARCLDALPRKVRTWTAKRLLQEALTQRDYELYAFCMTLCLHEVYSLNIPRFGKDEILYSLERAKQRFPVGNYYYLTDMNLDQLPLKPEKFGFTRIERLEGLPNSTESPTVLLCLFEEDEGLVSVIRNVWPLKNAYFYTPRAYTPAARYFHRNRIAKLTIATDFERNEKLENFDLADFENLIQAIDITKGLPGDYVEIGVYRGRSAHLALSYMVNALVARRAYFIDSFEGFSDDSAKRDQDATWFGKFAKTSVEDVRKTLSTFDNAILVRGNIVHHELPSDIHQVALCNIDVDTYEAVLNALTKVAPLIVEKGLIVVEDQGHTPYITGATIAIDEFLRTSIGSRFLPVHMTSGQAFLIRTSMSGPGEAPSLPT